MNTKFERVLKKTSTITSAVTDPVIPKGKYRAAIGYKFEAETEPDFAEYLVCKTMVDLQVWLQAGCDGKFGNLLSSAIFQTDPDTEITTAIILWGDHRCFDPDVSKYEVAVALSELVWISPYEKDLLSAQRFVVTAKNQITGNTIKNFEKFLISGEYAGKTYLLS
jgi:hypothetical protein